MIDKKHKISSNFKFSSVEWSIFESIFLDLNEARNVGKLSQQWFQMRLDIDIVKEINQSK